MVNIKVYVINLKHKKEKRIQMETQLKKINFDYTFIDATYWKDININDCKIDNNFRNLYTNTVMTQGEIGCAMSHHSVWQLAQQENVDYSIILEDDIHITTDKFQDIIHEIVEKIDFDMFYLSRICNNPENETIYKSTHRYNIVKPGHSYWLCGYVLSKNGLNKLVNSGFEQNLITVDEFIPSLYDNIDTLNYITPHLYNINTIDVYALDTNLIMPNENTFIDSETDHSPYYSLYNNTNNLDFFNGEFIVVTVATDKNDCFERFMNSCKIYGIPVHVLGMDVSWNGNNMLEQEGGGHKVNMLKGFLSRFSDDDNRLVLFTDSYDVVFCNSPHQILRKWKEISVATGCKIVFSAEATLWPNNNENESDFPDVNSPFKYLNSGGFMGKICDLKEMTQDEILDSEDDQYYFQRKYTSSKNGTIIIDYMSHLFQTLSTHHENIIVDHDFCNVINKKYGTSPCVIHGNGGIDIKHFFNSLNNFLLFNYRNYYETKKILLNHESSNKKVLCIYFLKDKKDLEPVLSVLSQTVDKCVIVFHGLGEDIKYTDILFVQNSHFDSIITGLCPNFDYIYIGSTNERITNNDMFKILIQNNKRFVSPFIKNTEFYFHNSEFKDKIITHCKRGNWTIDKTNSSILVKACAYQHAFYNIDIRLPILEQICHNIHQSYNLLYLDNRHIYGC
jgi:GR25 family glycosyltransferase involved in LPS biosynthesis